MLNAAPPSTALTTARFIFAAAHAESKKDTLLLGPEGPGDWVPAMELGWVIDFWIVELSRFQGQ